MNISVIIPTCNEYTNLIRLQSFFMNKRSENIEIIVADSVETNDRTLMITFPYKYLQTGVAGRAAQLNCGARYAQGDILVFLHADVTPPPTAFEKIRSTIHAGGEFGFFAYAFDQSNFLLDINERCTSRKSIFSGGGDQIHFMTKALFDQMNGYDEKYPIMEDFDFVRRYKRLKKPFTIIQDKATVSARKYIYNSWLRVNLVNLIAFSLFLCRTNPPIIKKVYQTLLR